MVALVVLAGVLQARGSAPPPAPEPLHWFPVAAVTVDEPITTLATVTRQTTVPPPPLPDSLHWLTDVVSRSNDVTTEAQAGAKFAGPWQSVTVTRDVALPVAVFRVFSTSTVQATPWPPTLSDPLHWLIAGAVTALALSADPTQPQVSAITRKVTARTDRIRRRLPGLPEWWSICSA
ncbi:MAG: hypothetical protein JWQ43_1228 [Glaciihabitans sp.]|nr:hypothetical protein [Glaciihabitans sp.]